MKKITFLVLTYLICLSTHAQRYEKSTNLNFSTGFQTGGYNLKLGSERYINGNSSLEAMITYANINRKVENSQMEGKHTEVGLSMGYNYYFKDVKNYIFPFITGGAGIAFESLNNKRDFPNYLILDHTSKTLYRIYMGIGCEFNFNKISVFTITYPSYEFSYNELNYTFNVGVKYYF